MTPAKPGPSNPNVAQAESSSLSENLRRLDEIVRTLEDDTLEIETALQLFEEGVARLNSAQSRLADAETRVRRVLDDSSNGDGPLRFEPLDA